MVCSFNRLLFSSCMVFKIIVILPFLLYSCAMVAQKLSVSQDTFLIGQNIELTINPNLNIGDQQSVAIDFSKLNNLLYEKDTTFFEHYADVQIDSITDPNAQITDKLVLFKSLEKSTKINFSIFSIGIFVIINGNDSLRIAIMPPPGVNIQDGQEIKDIKPIIENYGFDYFTLCFILFSILLIGSIAYWYYRKYRQNNITNPKLTIATMDPVLSPKDEALSALQSLIDSRQYESDNVKAFQTLLTDILRQYTSRLYTINSFEMTSLEILDNLSGHNISLDNAQILKDLFSLSDQVKFAKAIPDHTLCRAAIDKAIYFVKNTNR